MEKERIHWVDIAKAWLIICVIITHMPELATQKKVLDISWLVNLRPLFYAYFMPAFFILNGYCSRFEGLRLKTFAWKTFKSLMILNILVNIGLPWFSYIRHLDLNWSDYTHTVYNFLVEGESWFLSALFLSRIMYFLLKRYLRKPTFLAVATLLLLVGGVMLNSANVKNVFSFEHALIMTVFIFVGDYAKNYRKILDSRRISALSIVSFVIVETTSSFLGIKQPCIYGKIEVWLTSIPIFILMALIGSQACFSICKIIKANRWLEHIGRESLVIYVFQMLFYHYILDILSPISIHGLLSGLLALGIIISQLLLCSILNYILNLRYLKWTLGKF